MSLSTFIEDTLPLIRHSINPEILMESNLPQLNYNIEADFTQMQMVLSAVVSNAAEAIEGKGCIRITSAIEDIVDHHPHLEPGCYACLRVEDDGKGMDEGIKNRMFEPFFTTNFQGRGLGMAAVYGIIQNHGGWISVDSELGKGTLVQLYLPAVEAVEKGMKEKESQLEEGSGTILIIEDEDMILEVCRTMLEKLNYRVLEARTGEEALNIVRTFDGDIDLSILDIGLPDMDGDKLYPLLKEARTDLKVIVCSGYAIDGPAQEILDAGAQGFIQKPYAFGMLSNKLKELLGG
jgi:CheY-like chemotaxis protein